MSQTTVGKLWHPASWQNKFNSQPIIYNDQITLGKVVAELHSLPPLVTPLEIETLKQQLAEAALGKRFLLQGGDCAESFVDCHAEIITNKLKILLQMSLILLHGLRKPIIRIGRMAGQYAKPRSAEMELKNNISLPSYRGDLINQSPFTKADRTPNPLLMLRGYHYSATTLNYIRSLLESGFANLLHPENWQLDFVKHSPLAKEYQAIVDSVKNSLHLFQAITNIPTHSLNHKDFYTSHEALHLLYEQALTHQHTDGNWYDLSTHFPWIGMRTAIIDQAHIEYIRGIANPIAIKIGPDINRKSLIQLINILNPQNEPGRLTLIPRLGARKVKQLLPEIISAVKTTKKIVLWSCDPMHGNTSTTQDGIKTRRFDDILFELQQSFIIHKNMDGFLGGVHFELTGDNVTECIGGARGLKEQDLKQAYKSLVDPRLNYEQALEMALLIAKDYSRPI